LWERALPRCRPPRILNVSILGPEPIAHLSVLTLAQALNSLGGSLAPLVAGAFILTDPDKIASKASIADTVRGPYIAMPRILVLGLAVAFSHCLRITGNQSSAGKDGDDLLSRSIWSFKLQFWRRSASSCTWGVEVGLASIWRSTTSKTQGMSSLKTASFLVSLYWFGALVGRLLGLVDSYQGQVRQAGEYLRLCAAMLIAISMFTSGSVAIWTLVLLRPSEFDHVSQHLYVGHRRPGDQ